ncbi:hypothetical protein UM582_09940 [Staphylococcus aureus]|nr:hypothetical protein UM582_09940 [Staphylococcus aureus]
MTEWTSEERYQRIEDVDTDYFKTLKQQVDQSKISSTISYTTRNGLIKRFQRTYFL